MAGEMTTPTRIAILGAGGLGKAAARIIGMKRELRLCTVCDSKGYVVAPEGLDCEAIAAVEGDLVGGYRRAAPSPTLADSGWAQDRGVAPSPRGRRRGPP